MTKKQTEEELKVTGKTETALKEDKTNAEVAKDQPEEIVEVKPVGTVKTEESIVAPVQNTTQTITETNRQKTNAQLVEEIKVAQKKFKGEKKVKVSIPSVLQAQLGTTQFVSVNGVHVNIPVDGEEYEVPETLAGVLKEMLKNLK